VAGWALLLAGAIPAPGGAQGLPSYRPVNPIMTSRSALGFQTLVPASRRWRIALQLDYGNAIEVNEQPPGDYTLDGEFSRFEATVGHDIGSRFFAQGAIGIGKAMPGFLDPFVTWWHQVFGFSEYHRESHAENQYDFHMRMPDGTELGRQRTDLYLTDTRLTFGLRHSPRWQTAATVALPTSNAPDGYRLGTVASAVTTTYRSPVLWNRLTAEGSLGLGYTPRHGDLAGWQREFFYGASAGARLRVVGQQSIYTNLIMHSPVYQGTTFSNMDNVDLSLDFGFLLKPGSGPEIVVGMVEDVYAFGPAIDLVFRLGVRW
jgi:hypothetical protein